MGSIVRAGRLRLSAVVRRAGGEECRWIRRGRVIAVTPSTGDPATLDLDVEGAPGDWFSVVLARRGHPTVLSNPIYVDF
jgi:hypothetical protein